MVLSSLSSVQAGGGRNEVDPRFISLFSTFNITFPSEETLNHIYSSILKGHLQVFDESIQKLAAKITQGTLDIYKVRESAYRSFLVLFYRGADMHFVFLYHFYQWAKIKNLVTVLVP